MHTHRISGVHITVFHSQKCKNKIHMKWGGQNHLYAFLLGLLRLAKPILKTRSCLLYVNALFSNHFTSGQTTNYKDANILLSVTVCYCAVHHSCTDVFSSCEQYFNVIWLNTVQIQCFSINCWFILELHLWYSISISSLKFIILISTCLFLFSNQS